MMTRTKEKQDITILVVDDDPQIRFVLRNLLEREAYIVEEASNGQEMFAAMESQNISLITLDLGLGGEDGLELARQIRAQRNVPIIMISGKGDMIDKIVGLELGADDYIAKPFHLREVLARVRAVLRRYEHVPSTETAVTPEHESLGFDGWKLDLTRRELVNPDKRQVELTTAEFNLLELLVHRPGRVLSRDNIMDLLKGADWSPVDRTIDNLVARLRKKIEADPNTPRLIKTVRGVGYVFTPEVLRS